MGVMALLTPKLAPPPTTTPSTSSHHHRRRMARSRVASTLATLQAPASSASEGRDGGRRILGADSFLFPGPLWRAPPPPRDGRGARCLLSAARRPSCQGFAASTRPKRE